MALAMGGGTQYSGVLMEISMVATVCGFGKFTGCIICEFSWWGPGLKQAPCRIGRVGRSTLYATTCWLQPGLTSHHFG